MTAEEELEKMTAQYERLKDRQRQKDELLDLQRTRINKLEKQTEDQQLAIKKLEAEIDKAARATPSDEDHTPEWLEWLPMSRIERATKEPKNTLIARFGSDQPQWEHYQVRDATDDDRKKYKSYRLKYMYRITGELAAWGGFDSTEQKTEPSATITDRIAELEAHIKELEASIAARDQLITDLRTEVERLQKETPVRRVKTGGKAKQIARELARTQRKLDHQEKEHQRLLAHCREIEAQLQEYINNANATLNVWDENYYFALNDESVVVSTTNGELRVWLDEAGHVRVHGAMNGERMTTEELNDVLAALVAARWHQEDAPADEDVEVAA